MGLAKRSLVFTLPSLMGVGLLPSFVTTHAAPQTSVWKRRGRGREGDKRTNLQNKGLISADRGTKATLMLTIPRSLFKSSTKDLSFPIFELVFQHQKTNILLPARTVTCYDLGRRPRTPPILTHYNIRESSYRRFPAWIRA